MGDWLRFCPPGGAGAEPAAWFEELGRIGAGLVRQKAAGRQAMAEVLAAQPWLAGLFASGGAGASAPGAALQRAGGSDSAGSPDSADSCGQIRALRSSACFTVVCGVVAHAGAVWRNAA